MINKRFSRLVVISEVDKNKYGQRRWLCKCDCGNKNKPTKWVLENGVTKSCGCLRKERFLKENTKHSMCGTRIYKIWQGIISRCTLKNHPEYFKRGISVCKRWRSFENFYKDMGATYVEGLEIDRIDNDGNYEPGNCRWATRKQQMNNTRRNHLLTFKGLTMNITQWSEKIGMKQSTLMARINDYGWSTEKALTLDIVKRHERNSK